MAQISKSVSKIKSNSIISWQKYIIICIGNWWNKKLCKKWDVSDKIRDIPETIKIRYEERLIKMKGLL